MGNPSPQPTPTTGLGTATKIALSASAVALTTIVAAREYAVTLSLGSSATTTLSATVEDVGGNAFTSGNSNVVKFKSYGNPSAGSPSWYRPSAGAAGPNTYNADVASVGATSGVITALHVGQCIVEASFPTFDGTDGEDFIYAQVIVTVTP